MAQWSLTTLREKLVKIGARIVRHGRYVMFQLAEVAVPRSLFVAILCRIDRLRGANHDGGRSRGENHAPKIGGARPREPGRPKKRPSVVHAGLDPASGGTSIDGRPFDEHR
jgi:hypothetical protein